MCQSKFYQLHSLPLPHLSPDTCTKSKLATILCVSVLLCYTPSAAGFIPGDVGPAPDPCKMDDTQSRVATVVLRCLPSAETPVKTDSDDPSEWASLRCDLTAGCVARELAQLTDECGGDEQRAPDEVCNKATASFVFVETFRRIAASARDPKHECMSAKRLRRLVNACKLGDPDAVRGDQSQLLMAGAGFDEDGVDTLVRRASVVLGGMEGVAGEMAALSRKRLMHGTIAIAITFALPVREYAQHGVPAAIAVCTCCVVVLLLQFGLLAYMAGKGEREREGGLWLATRKQHES